MQETNTRGIGYGVVEETMHFAVIRAVIDEAVKPIPDDIREAYPGYDVVKKRISAQNIGLVIPKGDMDFNQYITHAKITDGQKWVRRR